MPKKVRYTYRIRPGKQNQDRLLQEAALCRFVWNMCVQRSKELKAEGINATGFSLSRELTDWRGRYDWLAAGSSTAQRQTIRSWSIAQSQAFTIPGRGFPKFKSRNSSRPSINLAGSKDFGIKNNRLRLPKGVEIPVVWSRNLPSLPSSVRIYQDAVGDWWASFVVEIENNLLPKTEKSIGIDWGLSAIATTTDPEFDLPNARHGRKAQEKLTKYQRRMARRQPKPGHFSSNGYKKAQRDTAKLYRHIRWQRSDMVKKWARKIVHHHDKIAIEDFKPTFMFKNRKLARSAADAGVGIAKQELITRAEGAGRTVVLVPPAYTTMTCSLCGMRTKERIELSVRIFKCESCGFIADRDLNAARTILALAGFNEACVDDVRPKTLLSSGQSEHGSS